MIRNLYLKDHLIIPFGRPKWEIEKIKISKVTPSGTYLEGSTPFAYIDKKAGRALQIADFLGSCARQLSEFIQKKLARILMWQGMRMTFLIRQLRSFAIDFR